MQEVPVLAATGIVKYFGHVRALDGADVSIGRSEIHALVGDNGAGKSTLVKIVAGVTQPQRGDLQLCGTHVEFSSPADARRAGIETVFQDLALAGTLDAGENVFLGRELTVSGFLGRIGFVDRRGMRTRANTYLSAMGINLPSLSSPVENLSGGQMQAVAVARAVYWHPQLLIMDEPTAALGPYQTDQVLSVMQRVRDEEGISILLISHSLPEVFRVADRITVLRGGKCVFTRKTDELTLDLVVAAMTGAFTTEGNPPVVGL